jgi:hypothetical protein
MTLTFKKVISTKQSMREIKQDIKHIIDDAIKYEDTMTRQEYDTFIQIITKGKILGGMCLSDIERLFKIYIPSTEQLDLLLLKLTRICNLTINYLSENGMIFNENQIKLFIDNECIKFIINKLSINTNNPLDIIFYVMKLTISQILNNVAHIDNFIKIHRKYMTDYDIYDICVKLCDKFADKYGDFLTLLSDFLHFEPHIISKLFHYLLEIGNDMQKNMYTINKLYSTFSNIIKCTNENVKQYIDILNKNILILSQGCATYIMNALENINKIINKINTYDIYEIVLNSIAYDQHYVSHYNIMITAAHKHNIKYTSLTLMHAIASSNKLLINECIKQNIIPNNEHFIKAINTYNQNEQIIDYCIEHINPTIEHLCIACKNNDICAIYKLLDTKLIPTEQCFINVIECTREQMTILPILINYGGVINKYILEKIILSYKIPPKIFEYNVSRDDFFDICHCNDIIYRNLTFISFDTPQKILYNKIKNIVKIDNIYNKYICDDDINDEHNYNHLNDEHMDMYCYDELLKKYDDVLIQNIIDDAIKNGKYIITHEAIARICGLQERLQFLDKYKHCIQFK